MDQDLSVLSKDTHCVDSLLIQGETALLNGDLSTGLFYFGTAERLYGSNPKVYFTQGLSLFELGTQAGQEKVLPLAAKKFKYATQLNPHDFDAWQAWGSLLCVLGLNSGEYHYFKEAREKLNKAVSLSDHQSRDALSELYWDLGTVFSHLAEHSEEALDWHQAIQAFQLSLSFEENPPAEFWQDFGHACLKFAAQINDLTFFLKAVQCLKTAFTLDPQGFDCCLLLATALEKLYIHTHDEDHFVEANTHFQVATEKQSQESIVWLRWAQFLCNAAKRHCDVKKLHLCIEKCKQATALNAEDPYILSTWGEALALLGNHTEHLDLLHEAESKIVSALEKEEENPEILYSYGLCLQAFGHYFDESDYYYQAIEQFQLGLSIDRTCHRLWHAIGWTYAFLGEMESNEEDLKLALRFFQKALDLQASTYTLFDYASTLSTLGEISDEQHLLEEACVQFERVFYLQKNALYQHPDWLCRYACTLDLLGGFYEEIPYYERAVEIFTHVLMVDPDFSSVHHPLGIALSHLGESTGELRHFHRAIHHYRLSLKQEEDNDPVLLDWATALINLAIGSFDSSESDQFYQEAELKLQAALRLGNLHAYTYLAGLYSLMGQCERGMFCLKKAYEAEVLPSLDELLEDEWLDNVRSTSLFQEFLSLIERKQNTSPDER